MKRFGLLCGVFALGLGLSLVVGCDEDEPATCSSAMNHLYGAGCTLVVGGSPVSLSDAISGCNDERPVAQECGCGGQHQACLDCLAGIGSGQCEACNAQFTTYGNCMSACF